MASDPLHGFKSIILYYNHQIHNMLILGPSDSLIPYNTDYRLCQTREFTEFHDNNIYGRLYGCHKLSL